MIAKDYSMDILGLLALPMLAISVGIFGYLEPNYSHIKMSVSSLGAIKSSNTILMNIFGLFLPGIFVFCAAFGFRNSLNNIQIKFRAFYLLASFGIMFSGLASPLDAHPIYFENYTVHHVLAYSTPWVFLTAAIVTNLQIIKIELWHGYKWMLFILPVIFFVTGFLPKLIFGAGLVQRLLLLSCFGWVAILSLSSIQVRMHNKLSQKDPAKE